MTANFATRQPKQRDREQLERIRDWAWERHLSHAGLGRYDRDSFPRMCLNVWGDLEVQLNPDWADYLAARG